MSIIGLPNEKEYSDAGVRMYDFAKKIFPYDRSLTGEGVRETLNAIKESINEDLKIYSVSTGEKAYDWQVPKEWVIRDGYIEDEAHNHIIDFKNNNLYVLGYSTPIDKWVDLEELKQYIYTEPSQVNAIPYVTSYYKERFGFCMSQKQLDTLKDGRYHMYIDSELKDGVLNYGEVVIPGESADEILFSTYVCHPSMANNECSGPALCVELINYISSLKSRKYTYRFSFVPETLGSIVYLSHENRLEHLKKKLKAGFVLSCVGDNYHYSMITSKYGDTLADKALRSVIKYRDNTIFYRFRDRGSDERQYNSALVDLPVVCFCRSKFGTFPEYHTSLDNMDYVSVDGFRGSFEVMTELVQVLESNNYYIMNVPCEPQLGKRGLYSDISRKGIYDGILIQRDVISYSDGRNDILDMSELIDVPPSEILAILNRLFEHNLVSCVEE